MLGLWLAGVSGQILIIALDDVHVLQAIKEVACALSDRSDAFDSAMGKQVGSRAIEDIVHGRGRHAFERYRAA